jgi:hypothetical protein
MRAGKIGIKELAFKAVFSILIHSTISITKIKDSPPEKGRELILFK